jgi:hypothetical protein
LLSDGVAVAEEGRGGDVGRCGRRAGETDVLVLGRS